MERAILRAGTFEQHLGLSAQASQSCLRANYIIVPSWSLRRAVEWAPWGGQSGELELTVEPGFRKKEAHGQAPHAQHRIQAPGLSGVPGRRDPSRARQAS